MNANGDADGYLSGQYDAWSTNWVDVPLRELLGSRYDVDVVVAHDPDCLMESERAFGLLKKPMSAMFF